MRGEERKKHHEEAFLAGVKAARDGGKLEDCQEGGFDHAWEEGFNTARPSADSSIEEALTMALGGPPRRDHIWKPTSVSSAVSTGKFKTPPGDWVVLGNYNDKDGKETEWNQVFQSHVVSDGVYDVTDIPYIHLPRAESLGDRLTEPGFDFVQKHGAGNIYIANGYQVPGIFLFAEKPIPFKKKGKVVGSFGRGACAMFKDCPPAILIVAEDD